MMDMEPNRHNPTPRPADGNGNGDPRPRTGEEVALAPAGRTGVLAWFVSNHVAANLMMIFIIVAGVVTLLTMKAEVFQEIELDRINVTVPYPGATPDDVEQGIVQRVEEAIEGIRGIKRIRSVALEGAGTVTAELNEFADNRRVLSDIEQAVERIVNFPPANAEEPIIQELETNDLVIGIVLYGDVPERSLKQLADQMRDELTALPGISQVGILGARPYEISIELSEPAMRRQGLSFDQVAETVRRSSLDLPGGSVKTAGGEILLRTKAQRYVGDDFADIVLLTRPDGTSVRLEDVATIRDTFEDVDIERYFDGRLAMEVRVSRTGDEHALDVASRVEQYLQERPLPAGIEMATWNNRASFLRDRINLLLRNGWLGLMLVFLSLALFLDLRLAFWTTMGIPLSFMGGFLAMPLFGVSINMLSLFALIVVLGIVVDDAIVVGENVFAYRQRGMSLIDAAIRGVREMAVPVTLAVLTTIFAFLPLAFTAGQMGKITWPIPVIVSAVLVFSLIEALFILPAHLATGRGKYGSGPIAHVQEWVRGGLDWFIARVYRPVLNLCVSWRYVTLTACVSLLLAMAGLVAGGYVRFIFMGGVEGDNVLAKVEMPLGTPVEQTRQVVREIEAAALRVREQFDQRYPDDAGSSIRHMATTVGEATPLNDGPGQAAGRNSGAHLGQVNVELLSGERRGFSADQFRQAWREEAGTIPGISSLTFTSDFFSAGDAISVELSHTDFDTLRAAASRLRDELSRIEGVTDIEDSFQPGKRELTFVLTPAGHAAGLTERDVGRQVRQAFYGEEVQRVQRGRDDIKVMVRLPEEDRRSLGSMDELRIRLPNGVAVPLATVATIPEGRGYARIDRTDRNRVVTVSADVDKDVGDTNAINRMLAQDFLPQLKQEYPGLNFTFEGEQREQTESLLSLGRGMILALLAIYGLLAVQFRSYIQPAIVMAVIPFGMVGAVIGHMIMGYDLTILSAFGVVALSGVVVNSSLIMIDLINRERAAGMPLRQAILESGVRRFRPILLTTATTFLGLMPMILETSIQAKFLIPMAISLAFGVVFATVLTLLFVPTLYRILEDILSRIGWSHQQAPLEDPAPAAEPAPAR